MGEILGIGATHYPPGLVPEEYKPWPLARMLHNDPRIPEHMKDVNNWPEPMRMPSGAMTRVLAPTSSPPGPCLQSLPHHPRENR